MKVKQYIPLFHQSAPSKNWHCLGWCTMWPKLDEVWNAYPLFVEVLKRVKCKPDISIKTLTFGHLLPILFVSNVSQFVGVVFVKANNYDRGRGNSTVVSISACQAVRVRARLALLVAERWDSITALLTCSHHCQRLVQKRLSMCYYVFVIMHVKDPSYLS